MRPFSKSSAVLKSRAASARADSSSADVPADRPRLLHVEAGTESWCPTEDELRELADLFAKAELDPHGSVVVTRPGVRVHEVGERFASVAGEPMRGISDYQVCCDSVDDANTPAAPSTPGAVFDYLGDLARRNLFSVSLRTIDAREVSLKTIDVHERQLRLACIGVELTEENHPDGTCVCGGTVQFVETGDGATRQALRYLGSSTVNAELACYGPGGEVGTAIRAHIRIESRSASFDSSSPGHSALIWTVRFQGVVE